MHFLRVFSRIFFIAPCLNAQHTHAIELGDILELGDENRHFVSNALFVEICVGPADKVGYNHVNNNCLDHAVSNVDSNKLELCNVIAYKYTHNYSVADSHTHNHSV